MDTAADGLHVRRLRTGDLAAIEGHLLRLDMVSRNRRFHCGFGDAAVKAYVGGLDADADILFGAVDRDSGRVIGLAEARPAGKPRTVDLGVSVLSSHRRVRLAHALAARTVEGGFARGGHTVEAVFARGGTIVELLFDPDNLPATRIAAGLGAKVCAPGRAVLNAARTT